MSAPALHPLRFAHSEQPRSAGGVYAQGEAALALAQRLALAPGELLHGLRVAALPRALVALGAQDALPWVDGAIYVAACAGAPGLWLPTYCQPELPAELVLRAIAAGGSGGPWLLLPDARKVIAIGHAGRCSAATLRAWAEREVQA